MEIANGKSAGSGGALTNHGELTLERSTVRHSLSFGEGGGIWNAGQLTLISSTIAGNASADAGGGVYHFSGSLTVRHSTISDNVSFFELGGGVLGGDEGVTFENSITAGNEAYGNFGSADPLGGDYWGAIEWGIYEPTLLGQNFIGGDPKLSPLADWGSPTSVMPPLPGSPVIEGAVLLSSTPATDQLGNVRPSGPLPDIGAVEAVAFANLSLADSDSDGIPDLLEASYRLTVGIDDSAVDSDGDGSTDAQEIANMTNPFDSSDYLRITGFERISAESELATFLISFSTFPGLGYSIESDQNLDFSGLDHSEIVSPFVAEGYSASFEIQLRPARDFVRVKRN